MTRKVRRYLDSEYDRCYSILPLLAAGIGLIGGLASSAINANAQKEANNSNIKMQQDTNAQNEALTREAWARDDNAVQRRAADLQAAGLSQTLATGSPAGVSSPIKAVAPQVDAVQQDWNVAQMAMQAMQQQADYSMTRAQTTMLKNEAKREKEVVKGMQLDNKMKAADIGLISQRTQGAMFENQFYSDTYRDRVRLSANNVINSNYSLSERDLELQLKRMDISDARFSQMYKRTELAIKESLMREGLDGARLDNAIKQVTLDNALYEQGWYNDMGVPSGFNFNGGNLAAFFGHSNAMAKLNNQNNYRGPPRGILNPRAQGLSRK
jgi:hypothetical protein